MLPSGISEASLTAIPKRTLAEAHWLTYRLWISLLASLLVLSEQFRPWSPRALDFVPSPKLS